MRILVIPEDFRYDQLILKPLFSSLFRTLGRRSVRVQVCQDPLLGGIGEALKLDRLAEIIDLNPMADIFVLCVDRDGVLGRRHRLDEIEAKFGNGLIFIAENAWEEIETWVLAGLDLPNRLALGRRSRGSTCQGNLLRASCSAAWLIRVG